MDDQALHESSSRPKRYEHSYTPVAVDEEEAFEPGPVSVDEYIQAVDERIGAIVNRLREVILESASDIVESIKWGMPHYAKSGHLVYVDAKDDHVNLGFFRGDELALLGPATVLFQGAGGKLRNIRIFSVESMPVGGIREIVRAAVALNEEVAEK